VAVWSATSVIIAKRDGEILPDDAIRWFLNAYNTGEVADEQAAALIMAVFLNGLTSGELATWTAAMIDSGHRTRFGDVGRPLVDKHSTGGVGDKVSLILCPLMAAAGAAVPQVSGRGLGHTGGTLDKMASIPGWQAGVSPSQASQMMLDVGAMITAASDDLAPIDAKLYALRDVTGTVASIPLIASSIMSKKIASGTKSLVLDVKVGRGAFMTDVDSARTLAKTMVGIGNDSGVATTALLTRMDQPIGRTVGNTIEVDESIEVLTGGGPADLRDLCLSLGAEMASLAGLDTDYAGLGDLLDNGQAHASWEAMVAAQGGDLTAPRASSANTETVDAETDGWVVDLNALAVGNAAMRLGAGRARKEDTIANGAGIVCLAKPGETVAKGQPVLQLLADDPSSFDAAREILADAITIGDEPVEVGAIVIDKVE